MSFVQRHLVSYLHEIIRRAPYLTGASLDCYSDLSYKIWELHTLKAINLGMPSDSMLSIARYRPQILHKRGASPLHLDMLKVRPQASVFALGNTNVNLFMSTLFSKPYNNSNFGFTDEHGYTILHYSLMNGNVISAHVLL